MAAEYIDYLIADPTLIPETTGGIIPEKIVYLPDSYQVNDTQRLISAKPCARADEGLGKGFCILLLQQCIQDIATCIRCLDAGAGTGGGKCSVAAGGESVGGAESRKESGAARDRRSSGSCLLNLFPLAEHLARQRLADLFLDTLPYNAHTTASDALWAGLPGADTDGRGLSQSSGGKPVARGRVARTGDD